MNGLDDEILSMEEGSAIMMKLYWSPRSRSFSALWLMEETGQPYERVLTDISKGAQKTPEYLAINPMGKVPALKDGEATLAEAAAICAYVAERYPQAKLAPPLGDPLRAKYLYWLFFGPGCVEPAMVQVATKIEMNPVAAGWGDAQRVYDVLDTALAKGPWILGENFSAADIVIGSGLNFSVRLFKMMPTRPSFDRYLDACCRHGRRFSAPGRSRRDDDQPEAELPSRDDAGIHVLRVVDAVDAESEQAKELALVFCEVGQFAERFGGKQRPASAHFRLNFGRELPVVDPDALRLVKFDTRAEARPEQAIDLLDAAFVEPELLHDLEQHRAIERHHRNG